MWLFGQGLSDHFAEEECEQWKKAGGIFRWFLWQSIDSILVYFWPHKTCLDIWTKARDVYSNDVQHPYDVVHNLFTL